MKLEGPRVGFHRKIREPTINRPGLALSGFYTYFAEKRVQVLGAAEHSYLKSLPVERPRSKRFRELCEHKIPCLVVSRGFHLAPELLAVAAEAKIAVFRTPMITMKFINAATIALEMDFSPTVTEFGSMVDILGVGVLIRGASGIGKSECVLGLIERGYSLVADDVTRITMLEGRELMATAPELTRNHMEVRGIGIINVANIFGIGSIRIEKRLDLVVTLKDWQEVEEVDRIGLDHEFYEILGLKVPHVTIPVRPGRDIARLIEVAAMDQKLKGLGQNAALEFNAKLLGADGADKERPNGIVVSENEPRGTCSEGRERDSDRESARAARPAGGHVCAHCQPVSLGNLGVERRRGSKRQKHHGPDDAGRRAGIEAAHSLRGAGCRKGDRRAGRADQRALQRRLKSDRRLMPRRRGASFSAEAKSKLAMFDICLTLAVDERRHHAQKKFDLKELAFRPESPAARSMSCATSSTKSCVTALPFASGRMKSGAFETALIQTRMQILEMQQRIAESIGAKDAAIFDAHLLVVEDRTLIDEVLRKLETDLCNVEWVFQEVATRYAETLSKIDDPYLRERALDIQDVTKRVIRNLQGKAPKTFACL